VLLPIKLVVDHHLQLKPPCADMSTSALASEHAPWHKGAATSPDPDMIRLDSISKQIGHQILFIEASAAIQRGEKVGLVGPNGAGKTTLFRLVTGAEQPDEGQVAIDRGVTIGYFSQDVGEMAGRSAVSEVMDGVGPVSSVAVELKALEAAMADPDRADEIESIIERYGEVQARFEELDGYALDARARDVLAGLGFSPEMMDGDVGALSGGWKMRVALARILLMRPDAMLLDEPSNHLDLESLIWLEDFLRGYEGALVMTSHDREFMNRIVTKVVEIDGGALTTYSGDYEFYEQQRALNERQQQAQFERQQAMLAKEIKFIERFKARASHAAQVQSRVKKLEKIDRVEPPKRRQTVLFEFPPAPRSGEDVASLKNVHKSYGTRRIYEGLDFQVRRRERWCVMGVNGAGKSTLLKLIAGSTPPDDGTVALGGSVKMGYFAQHAMDLLDGDRTVFQSLEDAFPLAGQGAIRALAGCFGFSGDDVEKKCRVLSGGEKARLVMAKMLFDPPNFLVLDEPTNHLDIATKEMLITALSQYEGTMLFVSHDRHFLAALSNRVLELTPEGIHQYGGGYTEYVARTGQEAPGLRH
jgi:ATPase subunit of ABC transporter with duplicated ATPase domains